MEGAGSYLGQRLWYADPTDTGSHGILAERCSPHRDTVWLTVRALGVLVTTLSIIMSQWLCRGPFAMALVICNTVHPVASG